MKIKGKFESDKNFITVYSNNTIYTISKETGEWGACKVGEVTACGKVLTQQVFDNWAGGCIHEGTFKLAV